MTKNNRCPATGCVDLPDGSFPQVFVERLRKAYRYLDHLLEQSRILAQHRRATGDSIKTTDAGLEVYRDIAVAGEHLLRWTQRLVQEAQNHAGTMEQTSREDQYHTTLHQKPDHVAQETPCGRILTPSQQYPAWEGSTAGHLSAYCLARCAILHPISCPATASPFQPDHGKKPCQHGSAHLLACGRNIPCTGRTLHEARGMRSTQPRKPGKRRKATG